ncbi:NACHT domain-containing protein [Candidatus Entotheonella palauensis]|uniref:NACHT domain-containing protein n=1 Tax=Candidatus Entotheonella palauensis TaxID=93172 RepID=UPI000B7D18B8|nr:NACHT domain-containing protein [Candidatus Entotheonella palauensis]
MPAQLRGWRKRMQKAKVESVYAFLAAATLWPVVQAARQGDWSALTVLGEVVSGAERHVLIERLPQWQDETEAAREIAAIIAGDQGPELRVEPDAVLEAVKTLELAQWGLRQSTRSWFVEALQRDGVTLNSSQTMRADLRGSGAIAQGTGSQAVGQGGIAITGNVYFGPPTQDPERALAIYRRVLMESCRHLTLRGLDMAESDVSDAPRRLDLHQIYVDLLTATPVPVRRRGQRQRERPAMLLEDVSESQPLRALEAVVRDRQVVLLGEPGSGKSTFLTYVAFCLAAHAIAPEQRWHEHLPGWPDREAHVVPITVVLRDFARWLAAATPADAPRHLWSFLAERLEAQNLSFAADPLHDCLERGDAILFLDGLDEIPTPKQRRAVRDAAVAFMQRYPHCRVVVTCRTLSYQDPAWQLEGVPSHTLAPFDTEQIEQFIAVWYNELAVLSGAR